MTATPRKMPILGIVVAIAALIIDQASKYVIVEDVMRPDGITSTPYLTDKVIAVLPVFNLRLSWNAGISFSLFNSGTTVATFTLLAVQVAVSLTLIWWLRYLDKRWLQVACGLIIGGAIGNILDRVMFGAVADFLDFYWGTWHFPTFNGADTFISIGAGMWLLDAVLAPSHDTASPESQGSKD